MNSDDIRAALRERYCKPEWVIFFEVANGTGSHGRRYADAVAMNLFPSRGLEINGFEIKVDRRDWIKELKNPEKAEPVFKYCDRWWIIATENVVRPGELPKTWGLIEAKNGKLRQDTAAPLLKPAPIDRIFSAALLRRAGERDEAEIRATVDVATREIRDQEREYSKKEIERHDRERKNLEAKLTKVKETTGIDLLSWTPAEEMVAVIKYALSTDLCAAHGSAMSLRNLAARFVETIDKTITKAN